MSCMDSIKNKLRESGRYPYTYACDLLRQAGLAESRADAAQLYNSWEEARELAERYICIRAIEVLGEEELKKHLEEVREIYS